MKARRVQPSRSDARHAACTVYKKFVIHIFARSRAHFFPLTISLNVELALKDG